MRDHPSSDAYAQDTVASPVGGQFLIRTRQNVRLGPLHIAIRSNEERFSELHYFPESVRLANDVRVHYVVNCCNLNVDGPWSVQALSDARDRSYRGKRFAAGYYITDHFGPPAYLITSGEQIWIFATSFAPILWPYVVKFLLTVYSADENLLHLKAACVAFGGSGVLLVGRGGSGKTVLLTRLCQTGAEFLTNTHALIRDQTLMAVPTAMRVRRDPLFVDSIATGRLAAGIKPGEYIADPQNDLSWRSIEAARIENICLLDYRGPSQQVIRELEPDALFNYMEHFSLAVNIYGLREDLFEYLGGDVLKLSDHWIRTKTALRTLISRCHCHYVSCDAINDENLTALRDRLTS